MPASLKQGTKAHERRCASLSASQNFLTSAATIQRILRCTSITKKDHVLEIGPGKGHITRALSHRCGRVTAIELDNGLFGKLRSQFAGTDNVVLIHMDFLKFKLPASGSYKVFSNIPFNHTTEILRKLTAFPNLPEEIWLVMEKGAAKRFSGKPHENIHSLLLKPFFDLKTIYHFRREDFHPMPGVDAVLLHLKRKPVPDVAQHQVPAYHRFVSTGLNGGLSRLLTPKQLSKALRSSAFSPDFTPATLLYVQWLCLFRCWLGI